ncbi:autotransporter outer membrane beta-barrel domain-containing protein [Ochrobactrum ciceri]|uniref:Autotransporter outer membrane beta-barrel domain-containing protein n=1 Tax=Brucella ciceri TaxID=391287 RepID=A0ABX1DWQ9_9HYPH|nr:autotransporter outer membrane beta-barrel domain-containing protein [Brucella ciceri]
MSPYVRVEGAYAKLDAFDELSGPHAISYSDQAVSSLAGVLGCASNMNSISGSPASSPQLGLNTPATSIVVHVPMLGTLTSSG